MGGALLHSKLAQCSLPLLVWLPGLVQSTAELFVAHATLEKLMQAARLV